ncbi:MAG: biopolymer transporter ExbD [Xanthomonadales bacterium]|nr:biopolymer transporter ExbD [Xanthomonadales bacterium]
MRIGGPRSEEPEISLTPLIDVVFTLIIFFVVTTTFHERAQIALDLPEGGEPKAQVEEAPLVVSVDREGRYYVGEREVLGRDGASLLAAIRAVAGEDRGRRVLLRADASASHQAVVTALDALGRAGLARISIATIAEPERR